MIEDLQQDLPPEFENLRGWEDIATCPRDKSFPVIVGRYEYVKVSELKTSGIWKYVCLAVWLNENVEEPRRSGFYAYGGYYDTGGTGEATSNTGALVRYNIDKKIQGMLSLRYAPTHWMPLSNPDGSDYRDNFTNEHKKAKQDNETRSPHTRKFLEKGILRATQDIMADIRTPVSVFEEDSVPF